MSTFNNIQNVILLGILPFLILICGEGLADVRRDIDARKKLVTKYKNEVKADLEFILLKDKKTDEQMRDFFNMVAELNDDKSDKMTELLADLIDFHIGEVTDHDIYEQISTRKKKVIIPLLKKKLSEKPLSFEKSLKERNEIIAELLQHIVIDVKYINDETHFRPIETIKAWLYEAQIALEKYYYQKGIFPNKLSEAFILLNEGENELLFYSEEGVYKQKIKYQSFGSIYFICTLGEDGIFGTKDDVPPPYLTEIYSFP